MDLMRPRRSPRIGSLHTTIPLIAPAFPSYGGFLLRKFDDSGFRPFDPARRGLTLVGMMRHAAKAAAVANGWSEPDINTIILGHGEKRKAPGRTLPSAPDGSLTCPYPVSSLGARVAPA